MFRCCGTSFTLAFRPPSSWLLRWQRPSAPSSSSRRASSLHQCGGSPALSERMEARRMRAMRLHRIGSPLLLDDIPPPVPLPGEVLIQVTACGVCRTDLHIVDGDLPAHRLPLVPGHEIVGVVAEPAGCLAVGTRVG